MAVLLLQKSKLPILPQNEQVKIFHLNIHRLQVCHETTWPLHHQKPGLSHHMHKGAKQYAGETKREFKFRMAEHVWNARHVKRETPVSIHFNEPDHSFENMMFQIIQTLLTDPEDGRSTTRRQICKRLDLPASLPETLGSQYVQIRHQGTQPFSLCLHKWFYSTEQID